MVVIVQIDIFWAVTLYSLLDHYNSTIRFPLLSRVKLVREESICLSEQIRNNGLSLSEHLRYTVQPENGGSVFFRNVIIHLQDYGVSQSRRPQSA
jgi:hypothetical protein